MLKNSIKFLFVSLVPLYLCLTHVAAQNAIFGTLQQIDGQIVQRCNVEVVRCAPPTSRNASELSGTEGLRLAEIFTKLATTYRLQGEYQLAEPFYKRALAIRERILGPKHPHVATSLNNLAELYEFQKGYAEAQQLFMRALAIRIEILGRGHPEVATNLTSLALVYRAQGKDAESELLFNPDFPDR